MRWLRPCRRGARPLVNRQAAVLLQDSRPNAAGATGRVPHPPGGRPGAARAVTGSPGSYRLAAQTAGGGATGSAASSAIGATAGVRGARRNTCSQSSVAVFIM
jgi:hypothetical protein